MNPTAILGLLRETITEWQADKASRLAAALAYYTVFSLAPLLIIAVATAGTIFGQEAAKGEIVEQIEGLVGSDSARVIETAISNANQPDVSNIASIISIIVLLFGASGVFTQLQDSLNTVWNVQPKPGRSMKGIIGLVLKRILSFSLVLGIGFLLVVSLILSAALLALSNYQSSLLPDLNFLWQIFNFVLSFGIVTLLFALMYKFLPDVKIAWSNVWIGAIITSLLFAIGKFLLGFYLGRGSFGSTYGAAASLVVLLAWVYYSAQILFLGAELTLVNARRHGSKIVPSNHAEFVTQPAKQQKGGGVRNN
ncbi:MAG: ribonuclease BN [Cyanobacteria bacterium SW_12_48_29]|nr:MAG: ribonuclease BN [Cyanobacteria bacterium SW_12_48_29]PSP10567.1 MAG: ribonuclease BN [Cyanobacteria bacterium SW_10_48_33]